MKKKSMKLFDYSKLSGRNEEELRENWLKMYKEELEVKKIRDEIKTNRYNRIWIVFAIVLAFASLVISIIAILNK